MSDTEQLRELQESVKLLAEISGAAVNSLKMLGDQNLALTCAVMILSASIKSQGVNISEELIEMSIKNLRENRGLNPLRDKLIRDLLFGNPLSAPVIPEFTVIQGGKDGPAPDPATD